MRFREFEKQDVLQTAELLANRHRRERTIFPALRKEFEDNKATEKILIEMIKEDYIKGICAYEGNRILGFLLSDIKMDNRLGRAAWVSYEGLAKAKFCISTSSWNN